MSQHAQSALSATTFLHAEPAQWVTINRPHHPSNALCAQPQSMPNASNALLQQTVCSAPWDSLAPSATNAISDTQELIVPPVFQDIIFSVQIAIHVLDLFLIALHAQVHHFVHNARLVIKDPVAQLAQLAIIFQIFCLIHLNVHYAKRQSQNVFNALIAHIAHYALLDGLEIYVMFAMLVIKESVVHNVRLVILSIMVFVNRVQ